MEIILASTSATCVENQGFIYGTITLGDDEQHTGFIRWDPDEAFGDVIRGFTFS